MKTFDYDGPPVEPNLFEQFIERFIDLSDMDEDFDRERIKRIIGQSRDTQKVWMRELWEDPTLRLMREELVQFCTEIFSEDMIQDGQWEHIARWIISMAWNTKDVFYEDPYADSKSDGLGDFERLD